MQKLLFLIPFILSSLFATSTKEKIPPKNSLPPPSLKDQEEKEKLCKETNKFYLATDFLIFQPKEDGLDYAIKNSSNSSNIDGRIVEPDFDWKFGFRLNMGYKAFYDFYLIGSLFLSSARDKIFEPVVNQEIFTEPFNGKGIIPIFSKPNSHYGFNKKIRYENAKTHWNFDFYNITFEMGKKIDISKKLKIRPNFGLKNTYIFQKYKINYFVGKTFPIEVDELLTPLSSQIDLKNHTIAIGPKLGVDTNFYIHKNTKFIFKAAGALLQTHFYTKREDKSSFLIDFSGIDVVVFEDDKIKNDFSSFKPFLKLVIGTSMGKKLKKTPLFINFDFAYEANFFFKINQFIHYADDILESLTYTPNGNLQLHGFYFRLGFLF
jgi:hypothetical protein